MVCILETNLGIPVSKVLIKRQKDESVQRGRTCRGKMCVCSHHIPSRDVQVRSWVFFFYRVISASPCNLALGDVHASLGHETHPPLGLLTAERVEVVNVRRLFCDLKVADTAVPLHTQEHAHAHDS